MCGSVCFISANVQAEVVANSDTGQIFKFKFELNKPVTYAIQNKSWTVHDSSSATRSSLIRDSADIRYKIRLTAISTNQDGTTVVFYERFELEQSFENVGPAGKGTVVTHGLDIISKQNDIVTLDTAKEIGISQARNLKLAVYPSLLSGYFNVDALGQIKSIEGDLPFIDYWQERLKYAIGFYSIVFPTNSISVHDSWTNSIVLRIVAGVVLNGNGIFQRNVFSRELDSQTNVSFTLYESGGFQNLSGYVEQSGQRTSVAIPDHSDNMSATFIFDPKLGRLISMKKTQKIEDSTSMMNQGVVSTGHDTAEFESSMTLVSP